MVRVEFARVTKLQIHDRIAAIARFTGRFLVIKLWIENASENRTLEYDGWNQGTCRLGDDFGNSYKRYGENNHFVLGDDPLKSGIVSGAVSIDPGSEI
jgi:hypothetical protein